MALATSAMGIPVFWILNNDEITPPWGRIARMRVEDFWRHAIDDWVYVDAINPNTKEDNERVTWIIKMIMLCASYPHIINNDERLRFEICYDLNEYDLTLFKNSDNYEYVYDTRFCEERPYIEECIIRIFEKESKKEVWRMGFTKEVNDYLRENPING